PTRAPGLGGQGQIAAFRPVDLPLPAPGVPAGAVVGTVNLMSRIAHLGGTTPTSRDFSGEEEANTIGFSTRPGGEPADGPRAGPGAGWSRRGGGRVSESDVQHRRCGGHDTDVP